MISTIWEFPCKIPQSPRYRIFRCRVYPRLLEEHFILFASSVQDEKLHDVGDLNLITYFLQAFLGHINYYHKTTNRDLPIFICSSNCTKWSFLLNISTRSKKVNTTVLVDGSIRRHLLIEISSSTQALLFEHFRIYSFGSRKFSNNFFRSFPIDISSVAVIT